MSLPPSAQLIAAMHGRIPADDPHVLILRAVYLLADPAGWITRDPSEVTPFGPSPFEATATGALYEIIAEHAQGDPDAVRYIENLVLAYRETPLAAAALSYDRAMGHCA